jgi:hypothetical protein
VQKLDGAGEHVIEGKLTHSRGNHLDEEDAVLVGTKLAVDSEAYSGYTLSVCCPHHLNLAFKFTVADFAFLQITNDMSLDIVNSRLGAPWIILAAFSGERLVHGVEHLVARQVTGVDGGATNSSLDQRITMVVERVIIEGTVACYTGISKFPRYG